jgi:thiosulfate/3-mercaptopyruvate sulfurtransferase
MARLEARQRRCRSGRRLFYLPAQKRDAQAEFLAGHIPGAVRFDVDAISDHANPLPHMLPGAEQFARDVGALGIAETDTIVVYDGAGMFSSPRVWWTFRLFGAQNVFVLEGGMPKWKAEGRPLETGAAKRAPRTFRAGKPPAIVATLTDVQAALKNKSAQVVDSRPGERFRGEAPEPRPGVRAGHIPGSLSVPSSTFIENGRLPPPDKIKARARGWRRRPRQAGDLERSGVAAAALWLARRHTGKPPLSLYDGPGRNGARATICRQRAARTDQPESDQFLRRASVMPSPIGTSTRSTRSSAAILLLRSRTTLVRKSLL